MKKYFNLSITITTVIYTIIYMSFGIPYTNDGALSKIGLDHRFLFCVWGILTIISLICNIDFAYKKYCKTKIYIPLLTTSTIGMILTLSCRFDFDIKVEYYLHCIGSLTFSAITGITIFILFILNYNKEKIFKYFTYITGFVLITDMILLFIFKENGLIESIPIFIGYLLLTITNLKKEHTYIETK